ncbi:MAG: hypothetical protein OCC49_07475 [Fibrobacterales bacterium]
MRKPVLITLAILNLLLAILHGCFSTMFNWSEELTRVSMETKAILEIFNIISIWLLLYFAIMTLLLIKQKVNTLFSNAFIVLVSGFYGIRLVLGPPYFGFSIEEMIVLGVCAFIIGGYAWVWRGMESSK